MPARTAAPRASVIIPSYNRCELLRQTLRQLTRQRLAPDAFEVIVSDDGSSDATRAVAESFSAQLRLTYHFQEDLGFRAAAARNAGARLATAPILVFLDTGALVGPDFLAHHLAAHDDGSARRAVPGYAYGYSPNRDMPGLGEALAGLGPTRVLGHYGEDPEFADVRHRALSACDFDLSRCGLPWMFFWTINCSIRADDFWAVGGFAEDFRGWGLEDIEFGFRVWRHGLPFHFTRDAWVIHAPHERDKDTERDQLRRNIGRFLTKHPEPAIEIGWALITRYDLVWPWQEEYRRVQEWSREASGLDVADEIAAVIRRIPRGDRIAVFGVGGTIRATGRPVVVMDFDRRLLDRAVTTADAVGLHAIGLRTPLPDQSVDAVIITSRLAGLWRRWGDDVLAEAHRIGRTVYSFDQAAQQHRLAAATVRS